MSKSLTLLGLRQAGPFLALVALPVLISPVGAAAQTLRPLRRHIQSALPRAQLDPSLSRAAERHASAILENPQAATLSAVSALLRREGLPDAQIVPFSALGSDAAMQRKQLKRFLQRNRNRGLTHFGVGAHQIGDRSSLVAVFVRRILDVAPLSRRATRAPVVVRGHVLEGRRHTAWLLGPCREATCASGALNPIAVERHGDLLRTEFNLPSTRSDYILEILADGKRGPEIAALWRFEGKYKRTKRPTHTSSNDRSSVHRAISDARVRAHRAGLEPSPALTLAASKHAKHVCATMVAAHVVDGKTPLMRARSAGYRGHVLENVAIAESVDRVHQNLMLSPSHRRNILSTKAIAVGIGFARRQSFGGTPAYCVVQLFGLPCRGPCETNGPPPFSRPPRPTTQPGR